MTSADVGENCSIAVDRYNHSGIAYYDATNHDLKYAHFNGTTWNVMRVDTTGDVGLHASLAFDSSNRPGISYYDNAHRDLKFAVWSGTRFVISTIDATAGSGRSSSTAFNTATRQWDVAYESHAHGQFVFAQQASSVWKKTIVDHTSLGGGHLSLAFGPHTQPAFSYYDATTGKMKFAQASGAVWKTTSVAASNSPTSGSSLFFDSTGANIVYYDQTAGKVRIADGKPGTWQFLDLLNNISSMTSAAQGPTDQVDFTYLQNGSSSLHLLDVP